MIALDRFSSYKHSVHDFKMINQKPYLIRSIHKEDLKAVVRRIAYTRMESHPEIAILRNISLEKVEGFLYDRFAAIVSQDLSMCVVDPETDRIVAAIFGEDAAVPPQAQYNEKKWPEFKEFIESDSLIRKTFPKIFAPKIYGVSINLVCLWSDPECKDKDVMSSLALALLQHPRILTYTQIACIFVIPDMEALAKVIPNAFILKKINFADLKDGYGNYYYRPIMHKFEEKGFSPESLRFLVFVIKNLTPLL